MENNLCSCCGQIKRTPNRHRLSRGLVDTLIIFAEKIGRKKQNRLHILKSGMGINKTNNFQKLRYFGLVAKGDTTGEWSLTRRGRDFLNNDLAIHDWVETFNNTIVARSEEYVNFRTAKKSEEYWQKQFNIEIQDYQVLSI